MRKSLPFVLVVVVSLLIYWSVPKQDSIPPLLTRGAAGPSPNLLEFASAPMEAISNQEALERESIEGTTALKTFLEIHVDDEKGQPISGAALGWRKDGDEAHDIDWARSAGKTFAVQEPTHPGTFLAKAEGYWSGGFVYSGTNEAQGNIHITLAKVVDYQTITCLDSRTKEPVEGVKFRCVESFGERGLAPAAGEWVSDAEGMVRLPQEQQSRLSFQSEVPANTDFADMQYWIYPNTETIEILHQGIGLISVLDDAGAPLSGVTVGVYADRPNFSGKAYGRFPIPNQVTNQEGQAFCLLLLDQENKVWVKDENLGYFEQKLTPELSQEEIQFQLIQQAPLRIKVEIPAGVPKSSLRVMVVKRGLEVESILLEDDGWFTVPLPSLNRWLRISAADCVTVSGSLRTRPKGMLHDPSFASGFLSIRLRRGYKVDGRAVWSNGEPAEAKLGLYVVDDDRSPYEVLDRKNATGWRWSEHHPLLEVTTGPQGEFHFSGLPEAIYYLDQVLEEATNLEGTGVWVATCSFNPSENYLVLPGVENPVIILPRFQRVLLRVYDSSSKSPISEFKVERMLPEDADGFYGSPAKGENGSYQGWMAVDDLSLLKLTAEGYLPILLDQAKIKRNADLWEIKMEMKPITPGRVTVYFDTPEDNPNLRVQIWIQALEPEYWSDTIYVQNGVMRELKIPTAGSAKVNFRVQSEGYELTETQWDYHAGEAFSLHLGMTPTEK